MTLVLKKMTFDAHYLTAALWSVTFSTGFLLTFDSHTICLINNNN